MPRLALAHLTVLEVPPPALFRLAAQAGFDDVGIRILPAAPGGVHYPLTDQATVVAWRRALAEAGVGVHDVEFVPLTPELDLDDLRRPLALAAELGARRLSVSGDDADRDRLVERYGRLCDIAAEHGLGVDLEFMRFRIVGTLPQALDIVQRADRANGRLLIDVLHLYRSGGTAQMLADVPARWIGSVQLCDAPRQDPGDAHIVEEAREGRLFPGEGELPLREVLAALPAGVAMSVEVPTGRSHPDLTTVQRAEGALVGTRSLLVECGPGR
jgi:sugar phosphate isomerase/epimerase